MSKRILYLSDLDQDDGSNLDLMVNYANDLDNGIDEVRITGDIIGYGNHYNPRNITERLKRLREDIKIRIIPGNHDTVFSYRFILQELGNKVIDNHLKVSRDPDNGQIIAGYGGSMETPGYFSQLDKDLDGIVSRYGYYGAMTKEGLDALMKEAKELQDQTGSDGIILMTHKPPLGTVDKTTKREMGPYEQPVEEEILIGSEALRGILNDYMNREELGDIAKHIPDIKLIVSGHRHKPEAVDFNENPIEPGWRGRGAIINPGAVAYGNAAIVDENNDGTITYVTHLYKDQLEPKYPERTAIKPVQEENTDDARDVLMSHHQ